MASKVHELVFKINGMLGSSFGGAIAKATGNMEKMKGAIVSLEKIKVDAEKFKSLSDSIGKASEQFELAKQKTEQLHDAFKQGTKRTKELKVAWQEAEERVQMLSDEMELAENPTKEMTDALLKAKKEARESKQAFKESETATKELGQSYKKAEQNSDTLSRSLKNQESQLKTVSERLEKAGFHSDNFEKKERKLEKQIAKTNKALEHRKKFEERIGKVKDSAKGFAGSVLKYGAAVAMPLKIAIDSESVMADVAKMTDLKGPVLEQFERNIRTVISEELPLSFKDMGELISNAAGAGIGANAKNDNEKAKELLEFSRDSAKLAVAFDIAGGEAGEMMAKWRSAFKMNQTEVVKLADKINYLADNSAAGASSISSIVSRIGAYGEIAGLYSGDVAALGSAMVSMGVQDEIAATGIKNMIKNMTVGAGATKKLSNAYQRIGLSSEQVAKGMQKDAQGTIMKLLENVAALDKVEQSRTLTEIFGSESVQAIAPLLNNLKLVKDTFTLVDDKGKKFAGSMQREFETRSKTMANRLQLLKSSVETVIAQAGKALMPLLGRIIDRISEAAKAFSGWMSEHPELFQKIVSFIAILGASFPAFKGMKLGFDLIKLAMNPITLKIGLIITALWLLYKNWDKIVGKLKEMGVWDRLVSAVQRVKDIGIKAFSAVSGWVTNLFQKIKNSGVIEKLGNGFKTVFEWVIGAAKKLSPVFFALKNVLMSVFEVFAGVFKSLESNGTLERIFAILKAIWDVVSTIMSFFLWVIGGIVQKLGELVGWLNEIGVFRTLGEAIGTGFSILGEILGGIGGIISGVIGFFGKLKDFIVGVFSGSTESVEGFFGFLGNLAGTVIDTVMGLFGKLGKLISGVVDKIKGAGKAIKEFFVGKDEVLTEVDFSEKKVSRPAGKRGYVTRALARGGLITQPEVALIGEAGYDETVIPLDGSSRAKNLWRYTGERLGLLNDTNDAGSIGNSMGRSVESNPFNFNISFNIQSSGGTDAEEIQQAISRVEPELRRTLKNIIKEYEHDRMRLMFS